MKRLLWAIALVSTITLAVFCGLTIAGCGNTTIHGNPAAHGDNSIGLKPGSTFSTLFIGGMGGGWTTWQAMEVRGNWVEAKGAGQESQNLSENKPVWINLDNVIFVWTQQK